MSKQKKPAPEDELGDTLTIRISKQDQAHLSQVLATFPLAKRGTVARAVFRRGLAYFKTLMIDKG